MAQIIRDVWPDDLEEEAIRIATRESNLIPTVKNYCCYGLFQIYYNAHRTWLATHRHHQRRPALRSAGQRHRSVGPVQQERLGPVGHDHLSRASSIAISRSVDLGAACVWLRTEPGENTAERRNSRRW